MCLARGSARSGGNLSIDGKQRSHGELWRFRMTQAHTVVFDLDGTLVDTAPDLINALNYVLDREGLSPIPLAAARNMIGAGARKLIERGLEVEGRNVSTADINRLTDDFIDYYAAHIADHSRPFEGLEVALDAMAERGYRFAVCTNKLEWLVEAAARCAGIKPAICGDLRRRYVRRIQTRPGDPATDDCTRGRSHLRRDHGRRCRTGYRRRPPRRSSGGRGLVRIHGYPDRGAQTGLADQPYAGASGGRRSLDSTTKIDRKLLIKLDLCYQFPALTIC